jgi:hypothetical protein
MIDIKMVGSLFGILVVVGGFLYWHFKTINGFKDDFHRLELKINDLQHQDSTQQKAIDNLNELYPLLKLIFETINEHKRDGK